MPLPDFMRPNLVEENFAEDRPVLMATPVPGTVSMVSVFPVSEFTATEFRDLLVAFKELQDKVKMLESNSVCRWCGLVKCQCGKVVRA